MPQLVLDNVSKFYGTVEAVRPTNLVIEDKEFAILVGPSGCGKSTLLRMIAGLEHPSGGEIRLGGRDITGLASKDRDVAMVFQDYALYPHMTVFDNMAFSLTIRKRPASEIATLVNGVAEVLGLSLLLARKPGELSGGQRQRVALGRAMVRRPSLFLFDEPLSNLDAALRGGMRAELSKLHRTLQATSIFVTHDQVEAMTMGTKIVVLRDGVVQQVGAPLEIYQHPANRFVAGFIGSPRMNMFDARIVDEGGGLRIAFAGASLPIPPFSSNAYGSLLGEEIVFGIRPADVRDAASAPRGPDHQVVKATVDVVEPLGPETQLYCSLNGNEFVATIAAERTPLPASEFELCFDMRKMHVFRAGPMGERVAAGS